MAKQTADSNIRSDAGNVDAGNEGITDAVVGVGQSPADESIEYDAEQPAIEPKKRRGRRSKAELEASGYYDGKPARKTTAKVVSIGAKEFAQKIKGAHHFAAIFTGVPVLQLNDEEAEQLSTAALGVLSQYEMSISPRAAAWVNLIATMGMIYGVRIYAFKQWKSEQEIVRQRENGPSATLDDINWGAGNAASN